jgi:hypothetical protein
MVPAKTPIADLSPIPEYLKDFPRVTEWWLEACLYEKQLKDPSENRFYEPFFNGEIPGKISLNVTS